jgi:transcriptional regulator with XRE-family HTH domain
MGTGWQDFYAELEAEAEGCGAAVELRAWQDHFRNEVSLFQARRRAGLSQRQLAARAHVEQAEVSRIERGLGNPTWKTVSRLLAACGARVRIELPDPAPAPSTGGMRMATARATRRPAAALGTRRRAASPARPEPAQASASGTAG